MLFFSRKAVKEEALQKASQTLDATVQRIDNILLSVEQTSGNFYFNMLPHLSNPDKMYTFSRQLLDANPYVVGCAIAFKPYYYNDRELFMAYYHRVTPSDSTAEGLVVRSETFGDRPYTEQVWFAAPMASGKPGWQNPLKGMNVEKEPMITFSLPIPGTDGKPVGVLGVDVALSLFSQIVLSAKPSAHSYCTLLDGDGSFIVHPDSAKLFHQTVFTQSEYGADPSVSEAAQAMVSGEMGYMPFRMNNTDYFVFYKPFKRAAITGRSMEKLEWSAGIIYPEDDIFGDYNSLVYYVLAIAIVGLLLIFILSRTIIHRQLKPLSMLTESAQRIAKGNYFDPIPDSRQEDEIGRLQDNFQQMQQTLATHISDLEQMTATLKENNERLHATYNQAQKAERMKIAFLHNMTNQMVAPAEAIDRDVDALCEKRRAGEKRPEENRPDTEKRDDSRLVDDIQHNGNTIAELLNNLLNISDKDMTMETDGLSLSQEKEVAHD